jgi:hypothetical protein
MVDFFKSETYMRNLRIIFWGLIVCGGLTSLCRADLNLIVGFVGLVITVKYYNKDSNYYLGLIFYLTTAVLISDLVWCIMILPAWTKSPDNEVWTSLSTIHSITSLVTFIGLALKITLLGFIIKRPDNTTGKAIPEFNLMNNSI